MVGMCGSSGPWSGQERALQGTLSVWSSYLGYESARSALSAAVSAVRCAGWDVAGGQDPPGRNPLLRSEPASACLERQGAAEAGKAPRRADHPAQAAHPPR